MTLFRFVGSFFLSLFFLCFCRSPSAYADPVPSSRSLRSRWGVFWGIATPVWRYTNGAHLPPWQQPSVLEITGIGYTLHPPWLEVRVAALFGQRLDRPGNMAGALASLNLLLPPMTIGVATVIMNTPVTGTNVGLALTFGAGVGIGRSGFIVALGGQTVTYPALGWSTSLVLGPSVSYRLP